jgi:hypothetical protein
MQDFGLGYVKDAADTRDYTWRSTVLVQRIPLPKRVVRKYLGRVLNQGDKPHCVAFSSASLKMHQERYEVGRYLNFDPAWLYYECKKLDGIPNVDGTYLRTALDIMAKRGFKTKDGKAYYKVGQYVRLESLRQIKEALFMVGPVLFGIVVDSTIYDPRAGGMIAEPNDDTYGGHAMQIVGYDDEIRTTNGKGAFLVKNSWGASYGLKGYIWLPYSHFTHYPGWDAWRTLDVKNGR